MLKKILKAILSISTRTANIIAASLLLASIAAAYINPDFISILGPVGLLYPYFLILNIIFVIIWIIRKRLFFVLSLFVVLLSWPQLKTIYAFGFLNKHKNDEVKLKVMTYNVRCFDLYNWDKNVSSKEKMFNAIKNADPDVVCFQEFFTDNASKNFNTIKQLQDMGYKHYFLTKELVLRGDDVWAIATFSKKPIVKTGEFLYQEVKTSFGWNPYKGIYTDIVVGDTTIRIINVHLQSIFFHIEDYKTIAKVKEEKTISKEKGLHLVNKLTSAFAKRGIQTVFLKDFLAATPHPFVLCGDFNDTPQSFAAQTIGKIYKDAFVCAGNGFGFSYNGPIPFLRIDYIFSSKTLYPTKAYFGNVTASDHKPLFAAFSW